MTLAWDHLVIVADDPDALARWWADALGWTEIIVDQDGDVGSGRAPTASRHPLPARARPKTVKNRFHLDFRPDDRDAEVERLDRPRRAHVDIGPGAPSWVVLADPEGNEFCVLRSR